MEDGTTGVINGGHGEGMFFNYFMDRHTLRTTQNPLQTRIIDDHSSGTAEWNESEWSRYSSRGSHLNWWMPSGGGLSAEQWPVDGERAPRGLQGEGESAPCIRVGQTVDVEPRTGC